jgi:signal recognition particle GTPase
VAIGFFKKLLQQFTGKPIDWDELEETLIRADLGVAISLRIIEKLREY